MKDEKKNGAAGTAARPAVVDRAAFEAGLDKLRSGKRRTPAKATRSPRPGGGCP